MCPIHPISASAGNEKRRGWDYGERLRNLRKLRMPILQWIMHELRRRVLHPRSVRQGRGFNPCRDRGNRCRTKNEERYKEGGKMSDKQRMCFTEPTAIPCPSCGSGVAEWCLNDGRERKWIAGSPVHLERIDAVNRAYPPRPYPRQNRSTGAL